MTTRVGFASSVIAPFVHSIQSQVPYQSPGGEALLVSEIVKVSEARLFSDADLTHFSWFGPDFLPVAIPCVALLRDDVVSLMRPLMKATAQRVVQRGTNRYLATSLIAMTTAQWTAVWLPHYTNAVAELGPRAREIADPQTHIRRIGESGLVALTELALASEGESPWLDQTRQLADAFTSVNHPPIRSAALELQSACRLRPQ